MGTIQQTVKAKYRLGRTRSQGKFGQKANLSTKRKNCKAKSKMKRKINQKMKEKTKLEK